MFNLKYISLIIMCLTTSIVFGQSINRTINIIDDEVVLEEVKDEVFLVVEEMPEFNGGMRAMQKFIAQNIKYPVEAATKGLKGRVIVNFVVNEHGEVDNIEVIKGMGGGCDEEVIRVVKMFPKWKPGKHNGRFVSVKFTIPIKFDIR